ncbi:MULTISPECIES: CHASE2 domain-containing protein [unclassified Tolypothrix]|uniref:CHASE2 domain-containing protein n=1 Tax=unclassified Tolypothrix TaxID=2649714 RepID=UPI0005EAB22C|nr:MULTISPECIES: CHASE2 domain-containing protein [unclassified Tolypothrix]BAY95287.1 putative Chase2 sensor protein [Microchaete diplosiphon NIES-3275]EKE98275.1 CHASE2 domain protein [Tolypothrix sp. PCC 7601]MBE9084005.1 CHASE2 domain-containing protein [Tolypothrix sp. LEGE 11397]UYD30509.1 CHASE2 domain-containing protein [Tolypothrix sp. PCC 7712]UYD38357.1 CHASE2 domain-containing protein [Tolypothrix sp. PCC 7601]
MTNFYLKIQKVEKTCLFELSWGQGQHITSEISYPENIIADHEQWQKIYINFYSNQLRGKVINKGMVMPPPVDWQAQLVQAEAKLLYEFHQWLRSEKLYEIRTKISKQAVENYNNELKANAASNINIFISCNSPELEYLPWEAWEISTELTSGKLRIVRQPLNVRQEVTNSFPKISRKAKILAIFGDDTGLSFADESRAISSLEKVANVKVKSIRWDKQKDINNWKDEIITTLTAQSWDMLFFAGHSNETTFTGGQISIAPNVSISLSEIEKPLTTAINNGLKFAIFNSCDGLSIANKLIDLGLSQVAIMREKIHNRVAGEFFVQFLNALKEYQDVHEALLTASDYLKVEKNLTYPSAYLIPSLFRHPNAELFRLQPNGIKHKIQQWLPTSRETVALGTIVILSLITPVRQAVIDLQIGMQAVYRDVTQQVPKGNTPPVLLIHIDEKSLNEVNTKANKFNPLDRSYFARLIDKLTKDNAKVIAIDYLFDRITDEDKILAKSVVNSINQNGTWFIFGSMLNDDNQEQGVNKSVANLNQTLQGYVDHHQGHLSLVNTNQDCIQSCPFTYLITLVSGINQEKLPANLPQPQSWRNPDLRTDLIKYLNETPKNLSLSQKIRKLRLSTVSRFSEYFGQAWLYPIIDYSLPPNQVYQVINAGNYLKNNTTLKPENFQQQVVLIGAAGYKDSGLSDDHSDIFPLPLGVAYWRIQNPTTGLLQEMAGVEINAYMIQNLIKQHLIIPIPDLWIIGMAILLGKGTKLFLLQNQQSKRSSHLFIALLIGGNLIYALISMQIYITLSLLVPLFLPSATFWMYILSGLRKKNA